MLKRFLSLTLLSLTVPGLAAAPPVVAAVAVPTLQQQVEALLGQAPKGTRFGLMVADDRGRLLVAVNPDMRFVPASNTKLFTTAAALELLFQVDRPDYDGGTQVFLRRGQAKLNDVVLYGRGDALLSSAADCKIDCLQTLADAVAAKTRVVEDIVGDDSYFPDQRWSPGMSWNNLGSNDATAASALSLDANEMTVSVQPGPVGLPPVIGALVYGTVQNEATTAAAGSPTTLKLEHKLNSSEFRLYGQVAAGAQPWRDRIGIDDPADYAATIFAQMLRKRGVRITGTVQVRHRPVATVMLHGAAAAAAWEAQAKLRGAPLAQLTPPPLMETIQRANKQSQNHHAEVLLRRMGWVDGTGALEDGLAAEQQLFLQAGVPREGFDLYDGSGMSTYNRVSPRAMLALLRWGMTRPWGSAWLASFPVAGRDGTLGKRFIGTALEGRIMAKTGTLNATNALSGVLVTASGRRLTFAFFANDVPDGSSAVPAMEQVLLALAAAN